MMRDLAIAARIMPLNLVKELHIMATIAALGGIRNWEQPLPEKNQPGLLQGGTARYEKGVSPFLILQEFLDSRGVETFDELNDDGTKK